MKSSPTRVLIIDDDPLIRTLLVSALRKDCLVAVAAEGSEGFYKALELTPDVAVIDVNMPGWDGLKTLEAFRAHPQIGQRQPAAHSSAQTQAWSAQEQSGISLAGVGATMQLEEANQEYLAKFGHIFIVCANGKSAGEMLTILRSRLSNSPEREIRVAAEEQNKITRLRLEKLLTA